MSLLKSQRENIHGVAHITGGGFQNIPRMNEALGYNITSLPDDSFRLAFMNEILKRADLSKDSAYETFNMGVGLVIACENPEKLIAALEELGEKTMIIGKVTNQFVGLKLA